MTKLSILAKKIIFNHEEHGVHGDNSKPILTTDSQILRSITLWFFVLLAQRHSVVKFNHGEHGELHREARRFFLH